MYLDNDIKGKRKCFQYILVKIGINDYTRCDQKALDRYASVRIIE